MKITPIQNTAQKSYQPSINSLPSFERRYEPKERGAAGLPILNKFITPDYQRKYLKFQKGMASSGETMLREVHKLAKEYVIYKDKKAKIASIDYEHFYLAYLKSLLKYGNQIKDGSVIYTINNRSPISMYTASVSSNWIWEKENIDGTIKIIQDEINETQKRLEGKSQKGAPIYSLEIDKSMMKDIEDLLYAEDLKADEAEAHGATETFFMMAITTSNTEKGMEFSNRVFDFQHKLSMSAVSQKPKKNDVVLPFYSELSDKVIKNADRNYDMIVTYSSEDDEAPIYFISNFVSTVDNTDFSGFKNLSRGKVKTIVFNDRATLYTVGNEIAKLAKDKDTQYFIVIQDFTKSFNSCLVKNEATGKYIMNNTILERTLETDAKNIHFVLMMNQDDYYSEMDDPAMEKILRDYQNLQIPIMDSNTTASQLNSTKEYIEAQCEKKIDPDALEYIASLPLNQTGSRYGSVLRFLKNASSYFVDEEKITKDMAVSYWTSTNKNRLTSADNSYQIIFDTNMNLDDIIGSPMVKKQAELAVYEIENFPKTKGYVIYNANGSQGGRMNCAKAIAGQAKIPMIVINAADFAIRDLDTVNNDPMIAIELKISKLINLMKTQAQTNPNRTVMLFISNFDNFASNDIYGLSSLYEKQAFWKLVKEMKKAREDNDYNIVVMGSSEFPQLTDEAIVRPGLFMDEIVIYPPSTPQNIQDIASSYAKKQGYEFGSNDTLKHFADIVEGSDYVDIVGLLDKANILAHRAGNSKISIPEINEAYLSTIAGQVSEINMNNRQKEAIIKHEGGHALNLQFMYNLFKEQGDNLRIGYSISNIALDPRGNYLGCVYEKTSQENTTEMNLETIMSSLVCCFGGNSSEEHFFGMEGSMGITQDMMSANDLAKMAVLYMGLGSKTGHFIPFIDEETGLPQFGVNDEEDFFDDVKVMLDNAKIISDKLIECYEGFLNDFSSKNISRFGTGNCIVTGGEFKKMLEDWEKAQNPHKKKEIERLKKEVLKIIEYTRKGIRYQGIQKYNPIYRLS